MASRSAQSFLIFASRHAISYACPPLSSCFATGECGTGCSDIGFEGDDQGLSIFRPRMKTVADVWE